MSYDLHTFQESLALLITNGGNVLVPIFTPMRLFFRKIQKVLRGLTYKATLLSETNLILHALCLTAAHSS
jgi:hypothetical protein